MLVRFLVPVTDNDGRPYANAVGVRIKSDLFILARGWTKLGNVQGAWVNPHTGKVEYDESYVYEVGIDVDKLPELDALLARLATDLGQHSIYRIVFHAEAECIRCMS